MSDEPIPDYDQIEAEVYPDLAQLEAERDPPLLKRGQDQRDE